MSRRRPPLTRALLAVLRFYRIAISPIRPPSCRYTPTCSAYAVEAIERFGTVRGGWLALRRLLRCHPFRPGGHDPVPLSVATEGVPLSVATEGVPLSVATEGVPLSVATEGVPLSVGEDGPDVRPPASVQPAA